MSKLIEGQKVPLKNGGTATVVEEIGAGGQGYVYKINLSGKEYALKWYKNNVFNGTVETIERSGNAKGAKCKKDMKQAFYENLENNINHGSPYEAYLWPKALTKMTKDGSFGYVMELKPKGYEELPAFCRKLVTFKSQNEAITAAIELCFAFKKLHEKGLSYQDLNDGNFFIDPNTGHIKICDNDNIAPNKINLGIGGKSRYVAPEIVLNKCAPNIETDKFSLAIVLFSFLFQCHPLDGVGSRDLDEVDAYGNKPVFILDPQDKSNPPFPECRDSLRLLWNNYPSYIKAAFTRSFSKNLMLGGERRIEEMEWVSLFMRLRSNLVECPHCKGWMTIENKGEAECPYCHNKMEVKNAIEFINSTIPLAKGVRLSKWNMTSILNSIDVDIATVITKPNDDENLYIQNKTTSTFKVKTKEGKEVEVPPNGAFPVREGIEMYCDNNNKGTII